ncbi:type II secretion system protein [Candidatus Saccharibacteria bacterium]|nr:type II secretion system protein [Candidatus Saccharibacteria bacterium]
MKKSSGFTIVEIALVLGIAGLIMVMAFVALPSLWSSQRDADRRAHVMNFISALKTFQTNNSRGALPKPNGTTTTYSVAKDTTYDSTTEGDTWKGFIQDYYLKGQSIEDPGGNVYKIRIINDCGASVTVGNPCEVATASPSVTDSFNTVNKTNNYKFEIDSPTIYVVKGATCDEDKNAIVKAANNRSVAAVQVLEKGKYCQNT